MALCVGFTLFLLVSAPFAAADQNPILRRQSLVIAHDGQVEPDPFRIAFDKDKSDDVPPVIKQLREVMYDGNKDPYSILSEFDGIYNKQDHSYGTSSLTSELVKTVTGFSNVTFWLEVGSFVGNSAITAATAFKKLGLKGTGVVCIDPFTGDVNMNHELKESLLHMDKHGHPRIYEAFLANVYGAGHHDMVLPLRVTSMVGMRLIKLLKEQNHVDQSPQVIYLDSAHEFNETGLELELAYEILEPGGILMGDDYSKFWPAVTTEVNAFAKRHNLKVSPEELKQFSAVQKAEETFPGVALIYPTWMIRKPVQRAE